MTNETGPTLDIDFLYWPSCPSHPAAQRLLDQALAEVGRAGQPITIHVILTEEEAAREHFVGSPTIRINGADVVDPGDAPPLLGCRLYSSASGRYGPLPELDNIRAALHRALAAA